MKAFKFAVFLLLPIILTGCVSESAVLTNDAGQTVKCENMGWGWLGAPVAAASQSNCVKKAKVAGYHEPGVAIKSQQVPAQSSGINVAFPEGWVTNQVSTAQKNDGAIISATNKTTDCGLLVGVYDRAGITDLDVYASSRRAAQESRLKDTTHTDVSIISVNGNQARRFEVSGTVNSGISVTYEYTIISGKKKVVIVNAWTSSANFNDQKGALQALSERVSGIE